MFNVFITIGQDHGEIVMITFSASYLSRLALSNTNTLPQAFLFLFVYGSIVYRWQKARIHNTELLNAIYMQ